MWSIWSAVASAPERDPVELENCRGEAGMERERNVHSKREAEERLRQETEFLEAPEELVRD